MSASGILDAADKSAPAFQVTATATGDANADINASMILLGKSRRGTQSTDEHSVDKSYHQDWHMKCTNTISSVQSTNSGKRNEEYFNETIAIHEARWTGQGEVNLTTGKIILHSGQLEEAGHHYGVAIILSKQAKKRTHRNNAHFRKNKLCSLQIKGQNCDIDKLLCSNRKSRRYGERRILRRTTKHRNKNCSKRSENYFWGSKR